MSTPYITLNQCLQSFPSSYNHADDTVVTQLIKASSDFIDNYCNRSIGGFGPQAYDELMNGTGTSLMFLKNCPIISIQRIATTELPALWVRNNNADMGCRALVQVTSNGLTLTYIASAITTTNVLLFATYPTIGQLVVAINALGNHWESGVMGGLANWSSTDLRATQGNFGSRVVTSYLWVHWQDLPVYRVNELNGEVHSQMGFARGIYNWRVQYTAGYPTLPNDLGQALSELVYGTYLARFTDPNVASKSLGGYSYSQGKEKLDGISGQSRKVINQYVRHPVPKFSEW